MPEDKVNTDGNWYDDLPAEVHESVKGFESQEAMVRDSIANKAKIPVIPENKDGYTHTKEEGAATLDEDAQKSFDTMVGQTKEFAEKVGMTQEQFTTLVKERVRLSGEAGTRKQKAMDDGLATLKEEWGDKFDDNLKKTEQVIGLFPESFRTLLKRTGFDHNADFAMGVFEISKKFSEDSFIKNGDGEKKEDANIGKDGIRRDPLTGLPMLTYKKTT